MTDKLIGRNVNHNPDAIVSSMISVGSVTSVTLAPANNTRIYLEITVRKKDMWVKLQAASVDNIAKGISILRDGSFEMTPDNMYTGEISGITDGGTAEIYVTEY